MSRKHHAKAALHAERGPYAPNPASLGHGRRRMRALVAATRHSPFDRSVLLHGTVDDIDDRELMRPSTRAVKRVSGGRVR